MQHYDFNNLSAQEYFQIMGSMKMIVEELQPFNHVQKLQVLTALLDAEIKLKDLSIEESIENTIKLQKIEDEWMAKLKKEQDGF